MPNIIRIKRSSVAANVPATSTLLHGELAINTADNKLFYGRADGTTGMLASGDMLRDAIVQSFIIPRAQNTLRAINDAIIAGTGVKAYTFGNSIAAGTGSSGSTTNFAYRTGVKLQAYAGTSTVSSWYPLIAAVGGQTLANVAQYVADNADGATRTPSRARWTTTGTTYAVIMSLRNEANTSFPMPLKTYRTLLNAILLQLKKKGIDAFVMIDPPQINPTTGAILDGAVWNGLAQAAREIAAYQGATLVDTWRYFKALQDNGTDLRPLYMADGTHPLDAGHELIATLLTQAILAPPLAQTNPSWDRPVGVPQVEMLTQYVGQSSNVATPAPVTVANTSSTTARQLQTGEATTLAYSLANAQSVTFPAPLSAKGVIITLLDGTANTGTVTTTMNGQTLETRVANGPYIRETSNYYDLTGAGATNGIMTSLNIAANGPAMVLGVTWLGPDLTEYHDLWVNQIETGAWSAGTLDYGYQAPYGAALNGRLSTTVGDYVDVYWSGTHLVWNAEQGTDDGMMSYRTDGGTTFTLDQYNSAGLRLGGTRNVVLDLLNGWHVTRFTNVAKNAASTGQRVLIGGIRSFSIAPDPSLRYLAMRAGDVYPLTANWKIATVERVISGTPYVNNWVPKAASVTLAGTGSALVRLER